jgi:hypothetical protein
LWVIFALLDPDLLTRLNPDPIRMRIRHPAARHTQNGQIFGAGQIFGIRLKSH